MRTATTLEGGVRSEGYTLIGQFRGRSRRVVAFSVIPDWRLISLAEIAFSTVAAKLENTVAAKFEKDIELNNGRSSQKGILMMVHEVGVLGLQFNAASSSSKVHSISFSTSFKFHLEVRVHNALNEKTGCLCLSQPVDALRQAAMHRFMSQPQRHCFRQLKPRRLGELEELALKLLLSIREGGAEFEVQHVTFESGAWCPLRLKPPLFSVKALDETIDSSPRVEKVFDEGRISTIQGSHMRK